MIIGKVIGNVVATKKDERLVGHKLLIIQPLDLDNSLMDKAPRVAVDIVGAGMGETVLVAEGSSARLALDISDIPIDAAVVGIVDTMEVKGQ
ncbi:MAG TPA: EutN/CcmL family microcompartment protein [Firmicutes bacterium]|jgi:microcompartment protein CcmK/EutM|nr:EutN/CcmL family microcompartment protein [Bacillota bacterium]